MSAAVIILEEVYPICHGNVLCWYFLRLEYSQPECHRSSVTNTCRPGHSLYNSSFPVGMVFVRLWTSNKLEIVSRILKPPLPKEREETSLTQSALTLLQLLGQLGTRTWGWRDHRGEGCVGSEYAVTGRRACAQHRLQGLYWGLACVFNLCFCLHSCTRFLLGRISWFLISHLVLSVLVLALSIFSEGCITAVLKYQSNLI